MRLQTRFSARQRAAFETGLLMLGQLASFALRQMQRMRAAHGSTKRMRVVETVALGEKRFAAVLQVDGTQFLVGGGAGSVTLLAMLPSIHVPDEFGKMAASAAGAGDFDVAMQHAYVPGTGRSL